jgi:hypothetical protein
MRTAFISFCATLIATSAYAEDSAMSARFGNTTIIKDAAGNESHIYYAADSTFTGRQGAANFMGTWKIDGNTVCLTTKSPIPNMPNPACAPLEAHKVGDTWITGPYTVSLVAGIQ